MTYIDLSSGVTGAIGPQGPTGTAGTNGTAGVQGATGPAGATNLAGDVTGPVGSTVVQFLSGVSGSVQTRTNVVFADSGATATQRLTFTPGATSTFNIASGTSLVFQSQGTGMASIDANQFATNSPMVAGIGFSGPAIIGPIPGTTNYGAIWGGIGNGFNTVSNFIAASNGQEVRFNAPTSNILLTVANSTKSWMNATGISFFSAAPGTASELGGGVNTIGIKQTTVPPTTNHPTGGILYVASGALHYRGVSGTVTKLGNA